MKKLLLSFGMMVLLAFGFAGRAFAAQQYSSGYFYYHSYEGYVTICGYFGDEQTVEVPSTIATKPVSIIETGAFDGCDTVENIILPDTIMEIQDGAFSGAENLVSVKDYQGNEVLGSGYSSETSAGTAGYSPEVTAGTTLGNQESGAAGTGADDKAEETAATDSGGSSATGQKSENTAGNSSTSSGGNGQTDGKGLSGIQQYEYMEVDDGEASAKENEKNLRAIEAALNGADTPESADTEENKVTVDEEGEPVSAAADETTAMPDDSQTYTLDYDGSTIDENGGAATQDGSVTVPETQETAGGGTGENESTSQDSAKGASGTGDNNGNSGKTGGMPLAVAGVVLIAAAAAVLLIRKKKKN